MGRRKFGRSESIRILRECAKGRPQKEVAKDFGCCSRTIAKIVNEADECIVIDEDHGESDVDEEESAFARRSMRHKQNSRIMHPSRTRGRSVFMAVAPRRQLYSLIPRARTAARALDCSCQSCSWTRRHISPLSRRRESPLKRTWWHCEVSVRIFSMILCDRCCFRRVLRCWTG
ncbi:hypothetical protein DENSPDRAFT_356537 [Dentipellis sp. KUC8613]|nr:hypothetical protein DENSPDRAFT_356537 [Dentipellis sp. KUC8613]